jgi:hypothetical protein
MNRIRQSLIGRCLNFFAVLAFLVLQVPGAAFADSTAGESEARKVILTAPPATGEAAVKATKDPAPAQTTDEPSEPGIAASLSKGFRSFMDKLTGKSAQTSDGGASGQGGQSSQAGTKVTHEAIKFFVPEKRIRLDAAVVDPKGVTTVRAYFKSKTQADYVFVPMEAQLTAKDSYVANLPAMAKSNDEVQYLFLVVNGANEVLKTEPFVVKAKDSKEVPSWQMVSDDGSVKLFTEVPDAPAVAASFSDSVSLNVVESGARFGLVAQLYGASGAATASGAAAGATNAGTTTAATAGTSATTFAVAAAAVVGVAAGGGSSGAAPAPAPSPIPGNRVATQLSEVVGNWTSTGTWHMTWSQSTGTCDLTTSLTSTFTIAADGTANGTTTGANIVFTAAPQYGCSVGAGTTTTPFTSKVAVSNGKVIWPNDAGSVCPFADTSFYTNPRSYTSSSTCSSSGGGASFTNVFVGSGTGT